jgi:NADH dehydrogenase
MRIFLTGATGFIGGHIVQALLAHGHHLTCLVRPGSCARLPAHSNVRQVMGDWLLPASWVRAVPGHAVVINSIGIIREQRGAGFAAVHTAAPLALFAAAAESGVSKIVQISALGADAQATSRYHRSKYVADRRLAELGVPYVVLRPSIVYGPGDHSMRLFARLAALPITPVPGDGHYQLQPVQVNDLMRAVVAAVERPDLQALTVDVGGAQALTFAAILDTLARSQGKSHGARILPIPWPLMRLVAAITDLAGGIGPITREELGMLRRGNTADIAPFVSAFGFVPLPFAQGIRMRREVNPISSREK